LAHSFWLQRKPPGMGWSLGGPCVAQGWPLGLLELSPLFLVVSAKNGEGGTHWTRKKPYRGFARMDADEKQTPDTAGGASTPSRAKSARDGDPGLHVYGGLGRSVNAASTPGTKKLKAKGQWPTASSPLPAKTSPVQPIPGCASRRRPEMDCLHPRPAWW
jgi:hypothetical protein